MFYFCFRALKQPITKKGLSRNQILTIIYEKGSEKLEQEFSSERILLLLRT
jgi:hypothetical protein